MRKRSFDTPEWYRALTLAERAARLRSSSASAPPPPTEPSETVRHRREAWKNQSPFAQGDWLVRRLAQEGLDETSFVRLLGVPAEYFHSIAGKPPGWLSELAAAFSDSPSERSKMVSPAPGRDGSEVVPLQEKGKDAVRGFVRLLTPVLRRARERLGAGLADAASGEKAKIFDPAAIETMILAPLTSRWGWMIDRTMVLELNVARLEGRLAGETPEARFASFVSRLEDPESVMEILLEYPVLARLVVECLDHHLEASMEFLRRLREDWPRLRETLLAGDDPGLLSEVQLGAGDPHRGGRSVVIARFTGGKRVVYKPRPMAVDAHFQELLDWLNRRGDHPPFRTLSILDRGDYGWVEFVEAAGCAGMEEIRRYHRRLGGLLAALHAVGAIDFHFENLIAAGEHPVPVDLETLFHPRIRTKESDRPDERLAARVLGESVLRVGLLPYRIGENQEFGGADLSGVASVAGKPTPDRILTWEEPGSDTMRAARKHVPMTGGRNRPSLSGTEVDVGDFIPEVDEGFREVYRLIAERREELLAPGGPVARFSGDATRAVLRSTRGYGLLLEDGFHPDFLRDALDRDRFFDRLWVGIEELPALERAIPHEHRDLRRGDIPYFAARPDSTDLWTGGGDPVGQFFQEPAIEAARRRILGMGEEDLRRQSWLTRTSLGTLVLNRPTGEWLGYSLADPGTPRSAAELRAALVAAARELGGWFDRMAVRDRQDLTWVGVDLRNQVWSLFPISEDLYAGTPGIALFLAYLSAAAGDPSYAEMARRGMGTLLRRLDHVAADVANVGLFQGWGGIVYVLAHLGSLWNDPELLARAERMIEPILARVPGDVDLDVVAGSAGSVEGLLALHRASGSRPALAAAIRCGEKLLETAKPTGAGVSWFIRIGGDELQTGFSHGASGIALALFDLAAASGDERFRSIAMAAMAFEREAFWSELERWLRDPEREAGGEPAGDAEKSLAMTWCYGAPGVGLARRGALRSVDDANLRDELARATEITLERGFGKNHCICHGDLGNLDLLQEVQRMNGDPALGEAVARLSRAILASIGRDGWRCGTVGGIESPGLMNGLAGIGYGLLRLADPAHVPSVLLMEPPRA